MISFRDPHGRTVFMLYEHDPLCVPHVEVQTPRGSMSFDIRCDVKKWLQDHDPSCAASYVSSLVEERRVTSSHNGGYNNIEYVGVARIIIFKTADLAALFKLTWAD